MSNLSLIVTIVQKGWGNKVLDASVKAGAYGGTILFGRGSGIHEKQTILGIPIEPEKEIVLTVTYSDKADDILKAISRSTNLCRPGMGIAFVVPVDRVLGAGLLCEPPKP
ncbi:MAG TPA: P-II family nitrogen regulator [Deltaproteobacteria bacterium]|jgi:nitrogen regulatory protein PII|nr:P-II family nitrogen regulator [Deltaproteobacteria bacterium]HQI02470.1 P-II family nitrogen regulator [Deltaproteobacteria bacterium]